jgi:hypothetical protein
METTVLNLKVPNEAHKKIKGFAVLHGAKLLSLAAQIIVDASIKEEVLKEALRNLQIEKK